MKLYEINEKYHNLVDLLDDDSLPLDDILNAAISIEEELTDKVQSIAQVITNMDAEISAFKAEETRLANRRRALENRKESLKHYLQQQMEYAKLTKVRGLLTVSVSPSPAAVDIIDKESVPEEYLVYKDPEVNKTKVKDALKRGEEIPGARLVINNHLTIR